MIPVHPRMALSNRYRLKRAAEGKPCFICGKGSEYVLDASDDFFYVCLSHVKDSSFCTTIQEEQEQEKVSHYQLHRSILYLREQRWEEKKRWSAVKKL